MHAAHPSTVGVDRVRSSEPTPLGWAALHPAADSHDGRREQELLKKRRIGRLQKSMGDYSLLAGSAVDAADHYQTAADLARACNDFIWLGGAIEGIAHARVIASTLRERVSM